MWRGAVLLVALLAAVSPSIDATLRANYVGAPDNRGNRFVFAFGENLLNTDLEMFVTTNSKTPVAVHVQSPKWTSPKVDQKFTVTAGNVQKVTIDKNLHLIGTEVAKKAILVTSVGGEITVYGNNKESASADSFLALPVDVLEKDYFAVSWYPNSPAGRQSMINVVGISDNTRVTIKLGNLMDKNVVTYGGKTYRNGESFTVKLDAYDALQLHTAGDLSGTRITGTKPIAVLSGNQKTAVMKTPAVATQAGTQDHLVEMLPPVVTWGKAFVTAPTPDRAIGDYYKVIASEPDTKVTVSGVGTYTIPKEGGFRQFYTNKGQTATVTADKPVMLIKFILTGAGDASDPAMVMIPPTEQYAADYTFATPKGVTGDYTNYVDFVIKKTERGGLIFDGKPLPSSVKWTDVAGSPYVVGSLQVTHGTHTLRHTNPTVTFAGYMYGRVAPESYGYPAGLRLAAINAPCTVSPPVVGDGIDNDCDGTIDEELQNGKDDDGDGKIDEDLAKPIADTRS